MVDSGFLPTAHGITEGLYGSPYSVFQEF